MNFYEKISRQKVEIPHSFDMTVSQLIDLIQNLQGYNLAHEAFKFGYMQGIRAERAGKSVLQDRDKNRMDTKKGA